MNQALDLDLFDPPTKEDVMRFLVDKVSYWSTDELQILSELLPHLKILIENRTTGVPGDAYIDAIRSLLERTR